MDLSRCSLNQSTVERADLASAAGAATAAGIPAIGLWRRQLQEAGLRDSLAIIQDAGLRVSSLCRGGFFTAADPALWRAALDDNRHAIDEAAAIGAPTLVLVPGGLSQSSKDLRAARARVAEALAELESHALGCGVRLAIEPMHPMFAADRGVISTLGQALDLASGFAPDNVGVVVDTYHVWWDPELDAQIERAGREGRLALYQVADWVTPFPGDMLTSRGIPGTGHIDFLRMTTAVVDAGYRGDVEFEVFSEQLWDDDPGAVALSVAHAHADRIAPALNGS